MFLGKNTLLLTVFAVFLNCSIVFSQENTTNGSKLLTDKVSINANTNKANTKLFIEISDNSLQIESVMIYNEKSELVMENYFKTNYRKSVYSCNCLNNYKINIKELKNGVYYARIHINDKDIVREFTKQKLSKLLK